MNNNIYDSSEHISSNKRYINYINKNESSTKSSKKKIKKENSNYSSSKSINVQNQIREFIQNTIKKEIIGKLNKKKTNFKTIINDKNDKTNNNYRRNINNRYKTKNINTNYDLNIKIKSNIFYNNNNTSKNKRIFSPEIYSMDKVKIMEDKIRRIKSTEKFKHYFNSRDKLMNLKKQKISFEKRINTLGKCLKKDKRENNINKLKIHVLEEEIKEKSKLPENLNNLIKETIKQNEDLELDIKNTYEDTRKIVDEISNTKNDISEMQLEIQEIKNTNNSLIKDKNDIINQINFLKKKCEIIKEGINKYNNLSNDLLYDVDIFMKSLK